MKRLFIQEIPAVPDVDKLFATLARGNSPFFIDSSLSDTKSGRFSFLGSEPVAEIFVKDGKTLITRNGRDKIFSGRPMEALRKLLAACPVESDEHVPFPCGAVGYFGYDLCHQFERLPCTTVDDIVFPDMYFALHDFVITVDHAENRAFAVSVNLSGAPKRKFRNRSRRRLDSLIKNAEIEPSEIPPPSETAGTPESNFEKNDYLAAVVRAKEYITAGDIYQVNLSQRFSLRAARRPADLYRVLRRVNPAPFSAFIGFGRRAVLSSSPERFMKLRGRRAETRPIKGTRPRREGDEDFNTRMRAELLASEKDAAELAMIVDLERNDLGRAAEFGTVKVVEPRVLEEYPTVYHLVATVEADLREDVDAPGLIEVSFPGGSITGAPKIRAMEIIDELEPTRRAAYTGSIGYIGFDGNMDTNIVIRTILMKETQAFFQVGGGIVADSDPEAEYRETMDKGLALVQALEA